MMMTTGWLPEMPTVAEVLEAGPTEAERAEARREQRVAEARRQRAADAADSAATMAWMAGLRGQEAPTTADVLARASSEPAFRGDAGERRRAAEILRPYGLDHVVVGSWSGTVCDPHLGVLEPQRDASRRAALEEDRALQRSEASAAENAQWMARYRARRAAELSRSGRVHAPGERVPAPPGGGEIWRVLAGGGNQAWQ